MAGVKINNLVEAIGIKTTDSVVVARNNETNKITGKTFIESFSGVKNAINYGTGVGVYKGSITSTNGAVGTSLQFNTLSGNNGIDVNLSGSLINISLSNQGIKNTNISDLAIDSFKLASNAVTTPKLLDGAVTPAKQSGTLCSVSTKTGTQSIAGYTRSVITGLSATVTPVSVSSKVLLTGSLSLGCIYGGIILKRTVDGVTTDLAVGIDSDQVSQVTFAAIRNSGDYNSPPTPITYVDTPNTTSPVTYSVDVVSTWAHVTYVNRGYSEGNANYSSRTISQLAAIVLP
jgi:hypothetical protein